MSEVKNEGLEVVAYAVSVTRRPWPYRLVVREDVAIEHAENVAPEKAEVQPLCLHSEALAGYAARDARITEQEAQIKTLQSNANSWQSGYDEGLRMGGKHCALTIDQLRAESAALKAQEPVAWVSVPDCFERYRLAGKFCEQRLVTDDRVRAIVVDAFASGYGFGIAAAQVAKQVVLPDADHSEDVRAMVVPDRSKEFSQFLTSVITAAGLLAYGKQSKGLASYLSDKAMMYMLAASPSAKESSQ